MGVKGLLDLDRAAHVERDFDDDQVLGTGHAAVRWVCNDLVTLKTAQDMKPVVRRDVRVRDERVMNAVGDPAKIVADLVFGA